MDCVFSILAVCLFQPSSMYVTADFDHTLRTTKHLEGFWCRDHWCTGPRATLKLGMTVEITREWSVDYGLKHQSFMFENDSGAESAFISTTWRPFK